MVFVVLMMHLIHAQTGGICKFLTICVCHTFVLLYNRIGEIMTYQTQIWTPVRRIFSLVVYQLSYLVPVYVIYILNPGYIEPRFNISWYQHIIWHFEQDWAECSCMNKIVLCVFPTHQLVKKKKKLIMCRYWTRSYIGIYR